VAASRSVDILRVLSDVRSGVHDSVAVEEPLEVRINGAPFAVIMRTPGADRELAAGFLLAEDVIRDSAELGAIEHCAAAADEARENTLNVTVLGDAVERLSARLDDRRQVTMTSSCGLCGRKTIESLRARAAGVDGRWAVPAEIVRTLPRTLRQAQNVFEITGGLHAAAVFSLDGALQILSEDVGRHNAVDKVIGRRLIEEALPLDRSMLFVSGRTSFELVQKALVAGVPLIAAVSAPSSLAVQLAQESGITLCGFVRGDTFNIYAHPERIT
jgi:FdhD protein